MSNRYGHYVWEALSQKVLNEYCEHDGVTKTARHKWIHLSEAIKILCMTPEQIYREGYRDFLIVRTNPFYYGWDKAHLDGIIHPEGFLIHAGKVRSDKVRRRLLKEIANTGLPSAMELNLFNALYEDPEKFHKHVRAQGRIWNEEGGKVQMDSRMLPKDPYNGFQLRIQRVWWEEQVSTPTPIENDASKGHIGNADQTTKE